MKARYMIPKEHDDLMRFVSNPYNAGDKLPPGEWIEAAWIDEDKLAYGVYRTQGLTKKEEKLYLVYVTKRLGKRRFTALLEYNKMLKNKAELKRYLLYLKEVLRPQGGDKV